MTNRKKGARRKRRGLGDAHSACVENNQKRASAGLAPRKCPRPESKRSKARRACLEANQQRTAMGLKAKPCPAAKKSRRKKAATKTAKAVSWSAAVGKGGKFKKGCRFNFKTKRPVCKSKRAA